MEVGGWRVEERWRGEGERERDREREGGRGPRKESLTTGSVRANTETPKQRMRERVMTTHTKKR